MGKAERQEGKVAETHSIHKQGGGSVKMTLAHGMMPPILGTDLPSPVKPFCKHPAITPRGMIPGDSKPSQVNKEDGLPRYPCQAPGNL